VGASGFTLGAFLWQDVDVVVSGVNLGPNLANAT